MAVIGYVALTLGLAFVIKLIVKFAKLHKTFRLYQALPGEKEYSIFYGNLHKVPTQSEARLNWSRDKMDQDPSCRKLMRYWHGPMFPTIAVYHPDTVKPILKTHHPKGRGFGKSMELLSRFLGNGIICVDDLPLWHRNRKMLTHAFHFDVLKSYNVIFNKACDVMMTKLAEKARIGETFDLTEIISLCVFEGILRCALGCGDNVQSENSSCEAYVRSIKTIVEGWSTRVRTIWMWPDFIFSRCQTGRKFDSCVNYVHAFNDDILQRRRNEMEKQGPVHGRKLDLIEVLLAARDDQGNSLTNKEISDEVNTFMAAGYDTTATATPWLLYNLAKHQDYQKRVQAELDGLGRSTGDGGQDDGKVDEDEVNKPDHISCHDLTQLPLLTLCAKESNRLYPPVPYVLRQAASEMVLDGHVIPKDTLVTVFLNNLHRHPDIWENPDRFYPERFSTDGGRDSFAYIPFAAGPRNCIGQNFAKNEMKVLTARILKRFNIELDPKAPSVERSANVIQRPANGVWVRLSERTRSEDSQGATQ